MNTYKIIDDTIYIYTHVEYKFPTSKEDFYHLGSWCNIHQALYFTGFDHQVLKNIITDRLICDFCNKYCDLGLYVQHGGYSMYVCKTCHKSIVPMYNYIKKISHNTNHDCVRYLDQIESTKSTLIYTYYMKFNKKYLSLNTIMYGVGSTKCSYCDQKSYYKDACKECYLYVLNKYYQDYWKFIDLFAITHGK